MDLALNNLQRLFCHKTQQTNQTKLILLLAWYAVKPTDNSFDG